MHFPVSVLSKNKFRVKTAIQRKKKVIKEAQVTPHIIQWPDLSFKLSEKSGSVGFNLMGMTEAESDIHAFTVMNQALGSGANLWTTGDYGQKDPTAGLHLLNRYFTLHDKHAESVVLSVKASINPSTRSPTATRNYVRRSIETTLRILDSRKHVDIFTCVPNKHVPVEDTIGAVAELVREGKISGIGLSGVTAGMIRRAYAVHPIACVEVEAELGKCQLAEGVAEVCAELGIPLVVYSRYGVASDDALETRSVLSRGIRKSATLRATPVQLSLAWLKRQSGRRGLPVIIPVPETTNINKVAENISEVFLTAVEASEIEEILGRVQAEGVKYNAPFSACLEL
ncbi:Aldo/keto reductase [Choiromyces venosus 120613-1]|uniref:Aldo/keto reductase n=1 Tax=Choiromyces venosus 120613-1 TaxID=1336337 RepID=A0A3N4JJI5_9PEZI|nr:Aldo/keto reductase [Choiromyces venosus 120613-1]